jgi:hypothetical protein
MKKSSIHRFLLANLVFATGLAGCGSDPVAPESSGTQAQALVDLRRPSDRHLAQLHITSEDGKSADVMLPENGSLTVVNEGLGVSYRLTGQHVSKDHLVVLVEQFSDKDLMILNATDVIDLRAGEESLQRSAITPFSMRMTGITTEAKVLAGNGPAMVTNAYGCCVTCGGWRVCCVPATGRCCTVSSSCGYACTACN